MTTVSDMTPEEFSRAITDAFKAAGISGGHSGGSSSTTKKEKFDAPGLAEFNAAVASGKEGFKAYLKAQKDAQKELKKATGELSRELETLDEAIRNETNSMAKDVLIRQREMVARVNNTESLIAESNKFASGLGKVLAGTAGKVTSAGGSMIKSLQSGGNGINEASAVMSAGAEMAGSALTGAGNGMQAVGGAMASATGKTKLFGYAVQAAGVGLSLLGEGGTKLAKFGIEVLTKEIDKTIAAFQASTNAGALYADGVTGMRDASVKAGLTVDQFASVLSKNSAALAESGLGVAEGTKRMGGALTAGGDMMRKRLLALGYSVEEQAGLVADTMASMKGSSTGKFTATDIEVAQQTQKYAENLRTISAITGEDAKAKSAAVKQQANQLAFQQKLASKSPAEQAATRRAMENMSEIERKNFMDMVNFGTVINKEGAVAAALSEGLSSSVQQSYESFTQGTLDENKQREIALANSAQVHKDMLANTAIGTAAAAGVGGLVGQLGDTMGKELQFRIKWNEDAIKAAQGGVEGQASAADKATKEMIGLAEESQKLKLTIQDSLTAPMNDFAAVAKDIVSGLRKTLDGLGLGKGMSGEAGKPGTWDKMKSAGAKALDWGTTGATAGGVVGAGFAGVGAVPGAIIGGLTAAAGGAFRGWMDAETGKAVGGIASGPKTGYIEKLHGDELVLPMNGNTIDPNSKGFDDLMKLLPANQFAGSSLSNAVMERSATAGAVAPRIDTSTITEVMRTAMASMTEMQQKAFSEQVYSQQSTGQDRLDLSLYSSAIMPTSIDSPFSTLTNTMQSMFDNIKTALLPEDNKEQAKTQVTTEHIRETKLARDEQLDVLKQQLEIMKQFVDKADQLLSEARDQKSLTQGILNAAY